MSPKISNEVIIERIEGMMKLIQEKFDDNKGDHLRIEAQTTKTNGRVNKLESWKDKVVGALIIMNLLLVPILIATIKDYI